MRSVILIVSMFFLTWSVYATEPDWNNYTAVLKHVKPGIKNGVALMLVDYEKIKTNGSLEKAYQGISNFDLNKIENRQEKLSFYINSYNILALKMVSDHWPVASIKDIGSWYNPVWNKPVGTIGGKSISLGDVENKILRLMHEPRIHFAIVCASVSCPNLRDEPYTSTKLNLQLDNQVQQFLNNQGKGLKIVNKTIHVSKIFNWFEDDFQKAGGVSRFIGHYKPELSQFKLVADIPYDWSVNAIK